MKCDSGIGLQQPTEETFRYDNGKMLSLLDTLLVEFAAIDAETTGSLEKKWGELIKKLDENYVGVCSK